MSRAKWTRDHKLEVRFESLDFSDSRHTEDERKSIYENYTKSIKNIDKSVVETAIYLYCSSDSSMLLQLSRKLSHRYFLILQGYCEYLFSTNSYINLSRKSAFLKQHGYRNQDFLHLALNLMIYKQQIIDDFPSRFSFVSPTGNIHEPCLIQPLFNKETLQLFFLRLVQFGQLQPVYVDSIAESIIDDINKIIGPEKFVLLWQHIMVSNFLKAIINPGWKLSDSKFIKYDSNCKVSIINPDEIPEGKVNDILKEHMLASRDTHSSIKNLISSFDEKIIAIEKDIKEQIPAIRSSNDILHSELEARLSHPHELDTGYGNLGKDPKIWVRLLTGQQIYSLDDSCRYLGEFRNRMYFTYNMNHLFNEIILSSEILDFIDKYLLSRQAAFNLNNEFIKYITNRRKDELGYIPPLFRYGPYANINSSLRTKSNYIKGERNYDDLFYTSSVEVECSGSLLRKGPTRMELDSIHNGVSLDTQNFTYSSGSTVFHEKHSDNDASNSYAIYSSSNGFNFVSGVSGTLDQSLTMSALVQIGIDSDSYKKESELYDLRLAYVVFMGIPRDHSLHEILFSSKSFGLSYIPGINICKYIYPNDDAFLQELKADMSKKGMQLPHEINEAISSSPLQQKSHIDKYEKALDCICSGYSLARTLPINRLRNGAGIDPYFEDELYYLKYPARERKYHIDDVVGCDRSEKFNFRERQFEQRANSEKRGSPIGKDGIQKNYTKKLSTTLLAPNGRTKLFHESSTNAVCMLYDYRKVNSKNDRYTFSENIVSQRKQWYRQSCTYTYKQDNELQILMRSRAEKAYIPFHLLRETIINEMSKKIANKDISKHPQNELLVGLNLNALIGIAVFENGIESILLCLYSYLKIKNITGIDLPMFLVGKHDNIENCAFRAIEQSDIDLIEEHYGKYFISYQQSTFLPLVYKELFGLSDEKFLNSLSYSSLVGLKNITSRFSGYICNLSQSKSLMSRAKNKILETRGDLWHRDDDINCCEVCGMKFNFVIRKHHCRSCGKIVCVMCSTKSDFMPGTVIKTPHYLDARLSGNVDERYALFKQYREDCNSKKAYKCKNCP